MVVCFPQKHEIHWEKERVPDSGGLHSELLSLSSTDNG